MTNMQYVCQALRDCGEAAAAQSLEMLSPEEWNRISLTQAYHLREGGATAAETLKRLFNWWVTREGHQYWEGLHAILMDLKD